MQAIRFDRFGGPEVLRVAELPVPTLRPGQVLVRARAIGVNLADVLMREDRYAVTPALPAVPGNELVGVVVDPGEGTGWKVGQRVAVPLFAVGEHTGAYAEFVAIDGALLVPLPEALSDEVAAALLVQGLTALALARHTEVRGKSVLVHAAAGGVGSLLVQLLKRSGARQVIAAASSSEKLAFARSLGADEAVDYSRADWVEQARMLSGGAGPDVVFDSVGGEITRGSLSVLAPKGTLVIYGALNIQSFNLGVPELVQLIFKNQALLGFAFVTLLTPDGLKEDLQTLFDLAARGALRVHIGGRYALSEAAEAHRALASRGTLGKLVLLPAGPPTRENVTP